ncbi:MAG: cation:proton antiporter [Planctomycetes bacterium]|nr:cation:proton antiporter [Planctomycetota bacterium]
MKSLDPIVQLLGICLIGAFIVGKIAHRIKVPKVTGFIVLGIFLGPSCVHLIDEEIGHHLDYFSDIALGLILFNIGGEFHKELLKKIGWKMVRYGLAYCFLVSTIVMSLCFILSLSIGMELQNTIFFSVFLGIVAMTAAPPTTLLVINEYDSRGILTDHIIVILALGTVLAIVLSQFSIIVFEFLGILQGTSGPVWLEMLWLGWSIVGSVIIGTTLGLGLSYLEQREKSSSEILLAVVCVILLGVSLSFYLHLEPLLVSFFLGFSLVNFSHSGAEIHKNIKGVGLSMYALFFIFAGSHIDLRDVSTIGLYGLIYAGTRTLGVYLGAIFAGKFLKRKDINGSLLGLGLLSHAGAALGIVAKLDGVDSPVVISTVKAVVSSIFVFEIIGPILLRYALIKSREIKVANILGDVSTGTHLQITEMVRNFLENTGLVERPHLRDTDRITSLVQRKVYAIEASANFSEVVKYIDSHHFPIYPVVDKDFKYEGLVDLAELKNVMFDQYLSRFVNARDLVSMRYFLLEDARLQDSVGMFSESKLDTLPVINLESGKLVGFISYKEVVIALGKEPDPQFIL